MAKANKEFRLTPRKHQKVMCKTPERIDPLKPYTRYTNRQELLKSISRTSILKTRITEKIYSAAAPGIQ